MTEAKLVSIMAVALALVAGGCGSDKSDGTTPTSSSGGSAGYPPASSTPDGTQKLSQTEVASLMATACEGLTVDPGSRPPVLALVVDTNDSLTQATPSTQGRSKWAMIQELLPQALASLPSGWAIGLSFYCRNESGDCYQGQEAVPVAPNDANQQTLLANAIQARTTCSYAPTQAAWTFGLDTILSTPSTELVDRYVVLLTDGVPTVNRDGCTLGRGNPSISQAEYDQFISTVSAQTTATGVRTFVVGVPGSDDPQGAPYDPMYELSLLGGGRRHRPVGVHSRVRNAQRQHGRSAWDLLPPRVDPVHRLVGGTEQPRHAGVGPVTTPCRQALPGK